MKKKHHAAPTGLLEVAALASLLLLTFGCSRGEDRGDGADGHTAAEGDHGDEHEGEERVEFTEAQLAAAGIQVEAARGGTVSRVLTMPAVVAANADTMTHVNPKAPGIVRAIHKHLGDRVEEGDLLCVIDSIELGRAASEFIRARALVEAAETTLEREAQLFQERLETAERVLDGSIEVNRRIHAREQELHDRAVSTIRPLLEAEKVLENSKLEKERQLTELRAERDTRLLMLKVQLTERRIERDAARNVLLALGVDPAALSGADPSAPLLAGTYEIRAPRRGVISGRHITAGEFVDSATKLYTLEDLSRIWILASAFEDEISSIRTGQTGRIHLDAFPGATFEGRVTLVGYEVDAESRALGVRLELENSALADWPEEFPLRPGMFGRVDLAVSRTEVPIVLPESAVVHEDQGVFVFVQVAPLVFERREIEIGPPAGEVVEVRAGVEPGERIAITGTFQLKSALRRGELGEGHGH